MMGSFRFAKYDTTGVGIDDPNATATFAKSYSSVPGDGNAITIDMDGNHAAQISAALASQREVLLPLGANLTLTQPIAVPQGVRSVLNLNESTLALAAGANCYMVSNGDDATGLTDFEIFNGTLVGNSAGQARNYGAHYLTSYFGFGVAITKAKRFNPHHLKIVDTESYGIFYDRCVRVEAEYLEFDQLVNPSGNGDGITGSATYIDISNVWGYTNDDMVAVTSGHVTLGGNSAGITAADCINIESVRIVGVTGVTKSGAPAWIGVGIYPTANKTIKSVVIDQVTGAFDELVIRIINYWTALGNGSLHNVVIANVGCTLATDGLSKQIVFQDLARVRNVSLKNILSDTTGHFAHALRIQNCGIDDLDISGLQYKANGAAANANIAAIYYDMRADRGVRNISVNGAHLERSSTTNPLALLESSWVSTAFSTTVSATAVTVPITTHPNGSRALPADSLMRVLNTTTPNQRLAADVGVVERIVMSGWAAGADAPCVTLAAGCVALSGTATATAVAGGTVIATVPYSMRPAAVRRVATGDAVLSVAPSGDVTIDSTTLVAGATAVLSGSYAI